MCQLKRNSNSIDNFYCWCNLPFGLSCSPFYFCKLLRCVIQYLRANDVRLVAYVDDIIVFGNECNIVGKRKFVVDTLTQLGWCINFPKSSLIPETIKEYIGYVIHTDNKDGHVWIQIPKSRITKLKKDINRCIRLGTVGARFLARIAGQIILCPRWFYRLNYYYGIYTDC